MPPNRQLQLAGAAMLVSRGLLDLRAAPATELRRSPALRRAIHDLLTPFPHGIGIAISDSIAIGHDPLVGQCACRGGNMGQTTILSFAIVMGGCGFLPLRQAPPVLEQPMSRADIQNAKERAIVKNVKRCASLSRSCVPREPRLNSRRTKRCT